MQTFAVLPKYFIQTKQGAYNGMIRHNIEKSFLTNLIPGTSATFSDLLPQLKTLKSYQNKTGKDLSHYFNWLSGSPVLVTPYTGAKNINKLSLQGFQKSHTEYLLNNRTRTTLEEYIEFVKEFRPRFAVTLIEELDTIGVGKKKIQRALKHSVLCYQDTKKSPSFAAT